MTAFPAMAFARELISALTALGLTDVVVAPGSRSGPLAHAIAEASAADRPMDTPALTAHVRIDERSAGFTALGIARAHLAAGHPRPVAVVTTSGTAVGNLLPAVMEAHHSGVPLLLLTADRPGELRGVGANQTTDQVGIFGTFVRWSADAAAPSADEHPGRATRLAQQAVEVALGARFRGEDCCAPGPVHLDLEFRAPLHNDGGMWPSSAQVTPVTPARASVDDRPLPEVGRGVVIAGDGAGLAAAAVAAAHGWPLLAEPTSGARCGPQAIGDYVGLLESDAGQDLARQVHHVVVIGRPTLARAVTHLIERAPALSVARHGARWREAPRHADRIVADVPPSWTQRVADVEPAWLTAWQAATPSPRTTDGFTAATVAATVSATAGPSSLVWLGSSASIRHMNRVAPVWTPDTQPSMLANRGLAGIDGTIATAMGFALGSGRAVTALMGDVTFAHDASSLHLSAGEARPDLRIVVVNDGGGSIFAGMEHAQGSPEHLSRFFLTPPRLAIDALCQAYGVASTRVDSAAALRAALANPPHGVEVVEAVVTRGR